MPRKRRRRWERKQKRGCSSGLHAQLHKCRSKPPLPSIFVTNTRFLANKMDELRMEITYNRYFRDCCILIVTDVGGLILDKTVTNPNFAGMAVFTPVINGVGGNLVAVQASRISTYLHMNGIPMGDPNPAPRKCPTPCNTFFGSTVNSRSARVLFLLVAPGHLVFLYTINPLRGGHTTLTPIFITFYLVAALLQVHMDLGLGSVAQKSYFHRSVGGNLVAVQASRISTYLHMNGIPMGDPNPAPRKCPTPCNTFFGSTVNSRSARVLFLLVAPGHLVFLYTINPLRGGHTTLTPIFITFYLVAALLQVMILLYLADWMVHWMWGRGMDPDNFSIPYLTALGDLLGTGFLALCFHMRWFIGDRDSDLGN
ncbi:solute carrier family 41 member 1-like [Pholidichthys leucotaenia]